MSQQQIVIDPGASYGLQGMCKLFGVTPRSIARRVAHRQLPKPVKVGRDPYWPGKVLQDWLTAKANR